MLNNSKNVLITWWAGGFLVQRHLKLILQFENYVKFLTKDLHFFENSFVCDENNNMAQLLSTYFANL